MRVLIASIALLIAGCAAMPDPRFEQFRSWVNVTLHRANAGEVKYSDFYAQAYDRLNEFPADAGRLSIQLTYAELISIARKYEAGEITRQQFDDARRSANTSSQVRLSQANQQQRAAQDARDMDTLRAFQMMRPAPAPMMPLQNTSPISCMSRNTAAGIQTICQ